MERGYIQQGGWEGGGLEQGEMASTFDSLSRNEGFNG